MALTLGLATLILGFSVVILRGARRRAIAAPLVIGYLLRAALAVVDSEIRLLPGHVDSFRFDAFAIYWARNGVAGTFEYFGSGVALYAWVAAVLYALLDRSTLMMQAINVLFGTLVVENVWGLALAISDDKKQARIAAWLTAVFPSLAYFSAVMLREVAVAYPLSLGVWQLALWHRDRKPRNAIFAVVALVVSMSFHSGSLAVLLAAGAWLVGASIRSAIRGQYRQLFRNLAALALAAIAAAIVVSSGFGMEKFRGVEEGGFEDIGVQQGHFAKGRTAYLADMKADTPADLVWQLPVRLSYFLFAPFPWMLSEAADLVGLVDSLFFIYLFLRIWRGRRQLAVYPRAAMGFGVFAAMALTFAVGVSNYGTAHRHRNKMLPLLIAAAMALPLARRKRERGETPMSVSPLRSGVSPVLAPAGRRAPGGA